MTDRVYVCVRRSAKNGTPLEIHYVIYNGFPIRITEALSRGAPIHECTYQRIELDDFAGLTVDEVLARMFSR